ncbi:hypothetical protein Tco_1080393 [Tanacetum coccineum]|uniref:Uncharacterized protein n=1 Tax=Tanacetum coccineum TaxID=301880 RepID=A0ABQ5HUK2_9ASTR
MKESEAYKTYHDHATGKVQPKPKYVRRYSRTKSDEAPKPSFGKRVKATAKVANSGTHEGTGVTPGVPDVPTYESDDEQISSKSSEEEDDDEKNVSEHEDDNDDKRTKSDNNGDDFVHPKFSTHDDEAMQDEEVNEEDSFDPRRWTKKQQMQRAKRMNYTGTQSNQVLEDTHVIITPVNPKGQQHSSGFVSNMFNPRPETSIDSIFTLNTETTSLVDVLITTIAEPPLVSATTLPPLPTPLITHMQQTLVPTPTTVPSSSLQDLLNFGSLFEFDHRLKTLETDFFEFKQTN